MLRLVDFFFFNDTATTEIYTLSLHDALPICSQVYRVQVLSYLAEEKGPAARVEAVIDTNGGRPGSGEHTSEIQARQNVGCRLLVGKKKRYAGAGTVGSVGSCGARRDDGWIGL